MRRVFGGMMEDHLLADQRVFVLDPQHICRRRPTLVVETPRFLLSRIGDLGPGLGHFENWDPGAGLAQRDEVAVKEMLGIGKNLEFRPRIEPVYPGNRLFDVDQFVLVALIVVWAAMYFMMLSRS